jgi:hypothetical protein
MILQQQVRSTGAPGYRRVVQRVHDLLSAATAKADRCYGTRRLQRSMLCLLQIRYHRSSQLLPACTVHAPIVCVIQERAAVRRLQKVVFRSKAKRLGLTSKHSESILLRSIAVQQSLLPCTFLFRQPKHYRLKARLRQKRSRFNSAVAQMIRSHFDDACLGSPGFSKDTAGRIYRECYGIMVGMTTLIWVSYDAFNVHSSEDADKLPH